MAAASAFIQALSDGPVGSGAKASMRNFFPAAVSRGEAVSSRGGLPASRAMTSLAARS